MLAALLAVGAVTGGCLFAGVNQTTTGFAYLITVLFIASGWGLTEAIVASLAAMLCYNFFFLPPVGQFTIADPQNWIALGAFLVTAIVRVGTIDSDWRRRPAGSGTPGAPCGRGL